MAELGEWQDISRRRVLKTGLATAAAAAMGGSGKALAGNQPQRATGDDGVRVIDIHAHYYPQGYLDVIADQGKPFGAS